MSETTALALPDADSFKRQVEAIKNFQALVRVTLVEGYDYGVIPGTGDKPTLLKPGAEKITTLLGAYVRYDIVDKIEDWNRGLFRYLLKAQMVHIASGSVIAEGFGECNSMESKYRWRWVSERDIPAGVDKATLVSQERFNRKTGSKWTVYRLPNEDIYSQVNTLVKMSKKRAHVDVALSAGRLSEVFTQDIEDLRDESDEGRTEAPEKKTEKEHWCSKHQIAFRRHDKDGKVWYSHKDGNSWCNEDKQPKAEPPQSPPAVEGTVTGQPAGDAPPEEGGIPPEPPSGTTPGMDIHNLGELFTAANKVLHLSQSQVLAKLGVASKDLIGDLGEAWQKLIA